MRKLKQEFRLVARKHIDCCFTLNKQKEGTFERIQQELVEKFPEFREQDVGSKRLELVHEYIVVSFIDEISHLRKGKKKQAKEELHSQQDGNSAHEPAVEVVNEHAEIATPEVSQSFESTVIKEFLESFNPSLFYLYPTFLAAGLVDKEALDAIGAWPRPNVVEFLESLGTAMKEVVVEALVLKLKLNLVE
ncbi:hypothetical protein B0H12DRAFT_348924 [Mycena haematopus]|nr:hypothetical protein B0H12DRAFT_348924 [Mycena haematopus]